MRFGDIPAPTLQLRVRDLTGVALSEQPVLAVSLMTGHDGEYALRLTYSMVRVEPLRAVEGRPLTDFLASGRPSLAHLLNVAADGSADLQLKVFIGERIEMDAIDVGVDEPAIEAARRLMGDRRMDEAAVMRELGERARYSDGTNDYFFLTTGEAARNDLEEVGTGRAFALHGHGVRMAVREQARPDDDATIFMASKVTRQGEIDDAVQLAHGGLTFRNWTAAGELGVIARAQISGLLQDESGYMKTWDAFGALEGELFLERARAVGSIRIIEHQETRAGVLELTVEPLTVEQVKAVQQEEELEFATALPPYLTDLDLDWDAFSLGISGTGDDSKGKRGGKSKSPATAKVRLVSANKIELEADDRPRGKWLILPVAGEVAQIRRRMQARARIVTGRSANPSLAILIEEKGRLPQRTARAHKPVRLSAMVQSKVFGEYRPTSRQLEAIDMALSTPDIALIQGPPGTGKTTVIAAIVEQINELADKRKKDIRGQVLLTGFQHDAVENLIARLTPNGLPVPKFGTRSGQRGDTGASYERDLDRWCRDRAEQLRANTPELATSADEENIRNLCIQYIKAPSSELARTLLGAAMALPLRVLGDDLSRRLNEEAMSLEFEHEAATSSSDLQVARSLRVRPESFADDGPATAYAVKEELQRFLTHAQVALLSKAVGWTATDAPDFLPELNELKRQLLVALTPPPAFRVEKARDTVVNLAEETMRAIMQRGTSVSDRRVAALHEFLMELETNSQGCVESLNDFSFAFAATAQYSVNPTVQDAKGVEESRLVYEYVIVDEAGRVGPRDLMIPLAQGKKIILVGDHRQLPHMLDKAVADRLEAGEDDGDRTEWLTKSMFEYLFSERLPALQEQDKVRRTVTLNSQNRMHPLLGEFVSENFYEVHDSRERFGSGRKPREFAHSLPGTHGKYAAWMDVRGRQARAASGSLTNRAEAAAIAAKLAEWMESKEGEGLKFGVISFYRAQADLIQQTVRGKVDADRLLVGTVDSFQGREFDVVFLSAVKTAGGFGFLELYNRLNVAMSRQERLLVAVGDGRFFETPAAQEKVPGLYNFLRLCRDKGVML